MSTYKQAGVDTAAGDELVERIKPHAVRTRRPEVLAGVGGFAGLFALPKGKYQEPVLVSGADGVGTKLKLAFALGRHRTVGIDLVAMNVNDILTTGAEPLFFLDYFATSALDPAQGEEVVAGIADGCADAGCTLLGGETAEVPGFYQRGEYELAGFAVGVVERSELIDGSTVEVGDRIIGITSSGFHSNGYSLVRKVIADKRISLDTLVDGKPLADLLMAPTRIYVRPILAARRQVHFKALAHITGGGIEGNLPRSFPDGLLANIDTRAWKPPAVFPWLAQVGEVPAREMFSTFNMGLGFMAVVAPRDVGAALAALTAQGLEALEVGEIARGRTGEEAQVALEPC